MRWYAAAVLLLLVGWLSACAAAVAAMPPQDPPPTVTFTDPAPGEVRVCVNQHPGFPTPVVCMTLRDLRVMLRSRRFASLRIEP